MFQNTGTQAPSKTHTQIMWPHKQQPSTVQIHSSCAAPLRCSLTCNEASVWQYLKCWSQYKRNSVFPVSHNETLWGKKTILKIKNKNIKGKWNPTLDFAFSTSQSPDCTHQIGLSHSRIRIWKVTRRLATQAQGPKPHIKIPRIYRKYKQKADNA